jgi:cardiolipin synthase A/B
MDTLTIPSRNRPPDISPDQGAPAPLPPAEAPHTLRVAGHDLTIFVESRPLIDALIADILAARRRVWIEVYIFFNDDSGKRVAETLKQKAREGLDVRVLYDALGCNTTPRAFFNDLASAGVKVHEYHSLLEGLRTFSLLTLANHRDHRKVFVIDDFAGYFGGMNIIDNVESVQQQKAQDRPKSSGWRDVHLRLAGPQQAQLADSFDRAWRSALGEKLPRRSRSYRRALLRDQVLGVPAPRKLLFNRKSKIENRKSHSPPDSIHFFDSGPGQKNSRAARIFTYLLRQARRNISISMAYFLPTGKALRALLRARRRGVRVRIIVPGKSDIPIVQRATSHLYDKLIRRGFRVYERRHRMLHSKVMIIDDAHTLVGSANFDPRSLYINLEFLAVIRSKEFAAHMTRICRFEISQSQRITLEHCRHVPWHRRLINRLAWSLRWWL